MHDRKIRYKIIPRSGLNGLLKKVFVVRNNIMTCTTTTESFIHFQTITVFNLMPTADSFRDFVFLFYTNHFYLGFSTFSAVNILFASNFKTLQ